MNIKINKAFNIFLIISIQLLFINQANAQRPAERNIFINPLADSTLNRDMSMPGWANSFGGWGAFGGYIKGDHDHAWYQELGAFSELYRFNNKSSLIFTAQIEFIADLHNNINFNPRAIFWEEGLFFMKKHKNIYWKLGYYHRCKHDIDNLALGFERSLIYGSLMGAVYYPVRVLEDQKLLLGFTQDVYTITYDSRMPKEVFDTEDNWYQLLTTSRLNFSLEQDFKNANSGFFLKAFSMFTLYSENEGMFDRFKSIKNVVIHPGFSTGIYLRGNSDIRLGFDYEYMPDTGIHIVPRKAHLLSFGIRVQNPRQLK